MLADARARLSSARKALADATVVSPIAGIVADRPVNTGDVVAPGTPLYTIVDPASMQLEASVPSESLAAVRVGARCSSAVRGYPDQAFVGQIERISPTADPVTRQVSIWVSVDNRGGRLVGGLFAEGRVTQEARKGLMVPLSVVDEDQGTATVLRVADGSVDRVTVTLGLRDPQTEQVVVTSGLEAGESCCAASPRASRRARASPFVSSRLPSDATAPHRPRRGDRRHEALRRQACSSQISPSVSRSSPS